jgi:hypothetical protein
MSGKVIAAGLGIAAIVGLIIWGTNKVHAAPPDPKVKAGPLGLGDIDGDGWVSAWDYDLCQQIRFGQGEFTEGQLNRADVDQDGVVSLMDYSSIKLIMLGQIPAL